MSEKDPTAISLKSNPQPNALLPAHILSEIGAFNTTKLENPNLASPALSGAIGDQFKDYLESSAKTVNADSKLLNTASDHFKSGGKLTDGFVE